MVRRRTTPPEHMYHLDLDRTMTRGANYALLPGDPFRSEKIARRIAETAGTPVVKLAWKREFCTYLAETRRTRVLVTSTGIGGPSASIAVDELARLGVTTFIRVGTTGAIQKEIRIGDVIVTTGSVRLDSASSNYAPEGFPAVADHEVVSALVRAARELAPALHCRFHVGITCSTDTFYPEQERSDSALGFVPRRFQGLTEELRRLHVLNYEMESATVLTLSAALGLRAGCITGVANNRATGEKISQENLAPAETNAVAIAVRALELLIHPA